MFENDSTYRGQGLSPDFYFKSPIAELEENEDEFNRHIVHLSDYVKSYWATEIKKMNDEYGLGLPASDELTSYENPDYLWLSFELENLRRKYNSAVYNFITGEYADGVSPVPYVQLVLKATACDYNTLYPKSTLNNYGKKYKPHYVVEFEQPFLVAYMNFITGVFDDNPQTYEVVNGKKVPTYQFRAPIYKTKPFDKYFDNRHDLPGIIYDASVQMLLAHELAHIGAGHLDLQATKPEYKNDVDVSISLECDADIQAIQWVVASRFLDVDFFDLKITLDDLFEELTLSVFAVYMLFTWTYSKDERVWNENTIKNYGRKKHLPYQLRAYLVLGAALSKMESLANCGYKSKDGKLIDLDFMKRAYNEIYNMIISFERAYHMFFAKTQDVYDLSLDGKAREIYSNIINDSRFELPELHKENIPLLLGFEKQGQMELKRVNDLWESVRELLNENGHYCRLRKFSQWIIPEFLQ